MEISMNKKIYKSLQSFSRAYSSGMYGSCLKGWDNFHKEWETVPTVFSIIEEVVRELDPPAPYC